MATTLNCPSECSKDQETTGKPRRQDGQKCWPKRHPECPTRLPEWWGGCKKRGGRAP
ncbi:hypothetical protein RvY_10240 [Ramazzottius varieornatus]|uniref:Uncharacterized protein n=1 Tax=Ramazzottius varieornatus TaxID=947166 RepID=A0A1D1VHI1_RAMVA|nr:hypothetical protein RvY_10240 [Ramazzottius varieornatus]